MALTPAQKAVIQQVAFKAQAMINRLAVTGSGRWTAEVGAFQVAWNQNGATIKLVPGVNYYRLQPDGLYGKNTAGAVANYFKVPVPTQASAIPVWAAQNRAAIDALGAPAVEADPVPTPIVSAPDPTPANEEVLIVATNPTNSVVTAQTTTPTGGAVSQNYPVEPLPGGQPITWQPNSPGGDPIVISEPIVISPGTLEPSVTSKASSPSALVTESEQAQINTAIREANIEKANGGARTLPDLDVYGRRDPTYKPLAIAIGALVLGGTLFYWTQRRR